MAGTPPFWSAIRTLDAVEFKARAVHDLPISLFDIYGKAWPQQAEFSSLDILRLDAQKKQRKFIDKFEKDY